MAASFPWAILLTSSTNKVVRALFDDTFSNAHQMAWFDWAMLIPYFSILVVLSVYGLHRYDMIRTYFKHKKKATGRAATPFRDICRLSRSSFRSITSATWWSG